MLPYAVLFSSLIYGIGCWEELIFCRAKNVACYYYSMKCFEVKIKSRIFVRS